MTKPLVPGFELIERIGRGGMGEVYKAERTSDQKLVALKLLQAQLADDSAFRRRFDREISLAKTVDHPNVVRVLGSGKTEDGRPFLEMDLVEGQNLQTKIQTVGSLDAGPAVALLKQVASGLDAIHTAGLIHRDIKPGNVLLDATGRDAYLTDFGLARPAVGESTLTLTGHVFGTIDYVSPEQIQGGPLDARADVYGLACSFFFVVTGEPPFPRRDPTATMWAHVHDPPPSLKYSKSADLRLLSDVFGRALSKDPADRFPSASDFALAAESALAGRAITRQEIYVGTGDAAPTALLPRRVSGGPLWFRRKWLRRTVATIGACLALATLLVVAFGGSDGEDSASQSSPDFKSESTSDASRPVLFPSPSDGGALEEVVVNGESKTTGLDTHCGGDFCQKVYTNGKEVRAYMEQFSFGEGSLSLCLKNPMSESKCRGLEWEATGVTQLVESDVSVTDLFNPESSGDFGVSWLVDGSKVGRTLTFQLQESSESTQGAQPGPGYEEFSGGCTGNDPIFPEAAEVGYSNLEALDVDCDLAAEVATEYVEQWRPECDGLPKGCEIDTADGNLPCSYVDTTGPYGHTGIGCYAARTGVEFVIARP